MPVLSTYAPPKGAASHTGENQYHYDAWEVSSSRKPTKDDLLRKTAVFLREFWMTSMGLDDDEIQQGLAEENIDIFEECEQITALSLIKNRNEAKDSAKRV